MGYIFRVNYSVIHSSLSGKECYNLAVSGFDLVFDIPFHNIVN
jgi:hypothetical protein